VTSGLLSSHPASFRDPSGTIFLHGESILRSISPTYASTYTHLNESGLFKALVEKKMLVSHTELDEKEFTEVEFWKVIAPEKIPFISYPYEWTFQQLKDAALLTLKIQSLALDHGMSLKDASAYNIQFLRGRPILIDTLSFDLLTPNRPWVAYRQFCQHFLAPLACMAYGDSRISILLRDFIDGLPLELAADLLPFRTRLSPGLLLHLHLHARAQRRKVERSGPAPRFSDIAMRGILDSLTSSVSRLRPARRASSWTEYYDTFSYSEALFETKRRTVQSWLEKIRPENLWDLGANTGVFARLASGMNIPTIAFDLDPASVELMYTRQKKEKDSCLLPLVMDLTNPSPSLGWHHRERQSLLDRGPAHTVLALALIHHLAIGNNVPLHAIASFFADAGKFLILEFVPKEDSMVQQMLRHRKDIFDTYSEEHCVRSFEKWFAIQERVPLEENGRTLFLMRRRNEP